MGTIQFKNNGVLSRLQNVNRSKDLITSIFIREKCSFKKVVFIFCNDDFVLELNQKFLNHNFFTDILTFTISEFPITSEIYISVDRVKENAVKYNISYHEELCRVMIHGILHLCGYTDNSKDSKTEIRLKEDFYLKEVLTSST